jgi:hypothetical protein
MGRNIVVSSTKLSVFGSSSGASDVGAPLPIVDWSIITREDAAKAHTWMSQLVVDV